MAVREPQGRQRSSVEIPVVATSEPGQVCARLNGELDISTVAAARDRVAELTHRASDLVLDLRGLRFIDSTGLQFLLRLAAESTQDGWNLSVMPGQSAVQRIFQLTDTAEHLPFRDRPEI
jgi:anti-sigma B factor antagonist